MSVPKHLLSLGQCTGGVLMRFDRAPFPLETNATVMVIVDFCPKVGSKKEKNGIRYIVHDGGNLQASVLVKGTGGI